MSSLMKKRLLGPLSVTVLVLNWVLEWWHFGPGERLVSASRYYLEWVEKLGEKP